VSIHYCICYIWALLQALFICYIPMYKQHFYAMPIFVIHKIETVPIWLAIFDIFQSHFVQFSTWIINILYTQFCMSYIGIRYKFLYKRSLYSGLPTVSVYCTILTNCLQSVTCDAHEHFKAQFTSRCDVWCCQKVFILCKVHKW
jgi:hypothetical protein